MEFNVSLTRFLPMVCGLLCLPIDLFAGGTVCPVAPAGTLNGRYYYYCMTGGSGGACSGSGTMGSDTVSHLLGCSAGACNHAITTGGLVPDPEVHRPDISFDGAEDDTLGSDQSTLAVGDPHHHPPYNTIGTIHSVFNYKAKVGTGAPKKFRIYLITHPNVNIRIPVQGTTQVIETPVPMIIAQEVKPGSGVDTPEVNSAAARARLHSNDKVHIWEVPNNVFLDNWTGTDPVFKEQFNNNYTTVVNGLTRYGRGMPALTQEGETEIRNSSVPQCTVPQWSNQCCPTPCVNTKWDRRLSRRACR
jgi:hypothetical protein